MCFVLKCLWPMDYQQDEWHVLLKFEFLAAYFVYLIGL